MKKYEEPLTDKSLPTPEDQEINFWYLCNDSDTVVVFIHGLFSDSRGCWLNEDKKDNQKTFWPDLVREDPRLDSPSIYMAGFYTALDAGNFSITQCAREVLDALKSKDIGDRPSVIDYKNLIFVTHSTGGIIARYLLERYEEIFKNKGVGLVLIASPSLGSVWANIGKLAAKVYNQQLGLQLQWKGDALEDIHGRFRDLVNERQRRMPGLFGKEACEHKMVFRDWLPRWLTRFLPNRLKVVTTVSAGQYFGEVKTLRDTDHFSTVKPNSFTHPSHEFLALFFVEFRQFMKGNNFQLIRGASQEDFIEERRRIDAAMPSQVTVERPTEIIVLICLPESEGLRATLPQYTESGEEIAKKDVRGRTLPVSFPIDHKSGDPLPTSVLIDVRASDFVIDQPSQKIDLSPEIDSGEIRFGLTPNTYRDRSIVHIAVKQREEDGTFKTLGSISLYTKITVAPKEAVELKDDAWVMGSIELSRKEGDLNLQEQFELLDPLRKHQKVIYGPEEYSEIYEINDSDILHNSKSVCALIDKAMLTNNGDGTSTIKIESLGNAMQLGLTEIFRVQPIGCFGSGFLVDSDVVATAASCLTFIDTKDIRVIFDFEMNNHHAAVTTIENEHIYSVTELTKGKVTSGSDWALAKIDRAVMGRDTLKLRKAGKISNEAKIYVIGHPAGLPKKCIGGGLVFKNLSAPFFSISNLPIYTGNPGSAVFNSDTHEVEGILVSGDVQFIWRGQGNGIICRTASYGVGVEGPGTADCTRVSEFLKELNGYN